MQRSNILLPLGVLALGAALGAVGLFPPPLPMKEELWPRALAKL